MTVIIRNAEAFVLLPDHPWGPFDADDLYALARIVEDRAVCQLALRWESKGSPFAAVLKALVYDPTLSATLADDLRAAAAELAMLAEGDAPPIKVRIAE